MPPVSFPRFSMWPPGHLNSLGAFDGRWRVLGTVAGCEQVRVWPEVALLRGQVPVGWRWPEAPSGSSGLRGAQLLSSCFVLEMHRRGAPRAQATCSPSPRPGAAEQLAAWRWRAGPVLRGLHQAYWGQCPEPTLEREGLGLPCRPRGLGPPGRGLWPGRAHGS